MRTRIYLGVLVLILIIATTGIYLGLARRAGPADLGVQALIPSYGVVRYRPAEPLDLQSGLLDTTVAGLFGSTENITAVKLGGPDGQVEVVDWSVATLSSDPKAVKPVAHLRPLQLRVSAPDRPMALTEIEFSFANGMSKCFPFGELRLVPRDETSAEDMAARVGVLWEVQSSRGVSTISPSGRGELAGLVCELAVSAPERAPGDCFVVSVDLGYPMLEIDESTACIVRDLTAFELALQGIGDIEAACLTEDRGLPLSLAFDDFQPNTTNFINVVFLMGKTEPMSSAFGYTYVHPEFTLDIAGEEIRLAAVNCTRVGGINPYSSEAADFLEEWGK